MRRTILVIVAIMVVATIGGALLFGGSGGNAASRGPAATTPTISGKQSTGATFQGPYGPEASWVVAENRLAGTTAWKITGPQTPAGIMGYASRVQAAPGQAVSLHVSTQAAQFRIEAFRMGYYQGKGARLMWTSKLIPGKVQAACPVTSGINMVQCSWPASTRFTITTRWAQGQYLLKLIGTGGQQSYIPLTVWDPTSHAAYVVMAGVLTDQVFNAFGGYDLYQGATPCARGHYPCSTRSRVVSFDRPFSSGNGASTYLSLVYPLTRLMEKHGLDVTYWTDITLAQHGNLVGNHRVLISPGHDEEWSLRMRQGAISARAKGVNLIFFGASPILRKVRLQSSPLGPDRQIVNYRNPMKDPLYGKNNAEVSQNWWGQPPASTPASQIVGAKYVGYNNFTSFPLRVSDPSSWFFANAGLAAGAQIPGVLSSDFQAFDPTRAQNPPGIEILAHSPVTIEFHSSRGFSDTLYYTLPSSKAGIFESGANSWIPSLRPCVPTATACPQHLMRTLTGNLLRVFGAGPVGLTHPSVSNWRSFYG